MLHVSHQPPYQPVTVFPNDTTQASSNTAAIQAALNAAGDVRIEGSGVVYVNAPLSISSNTRLLISPAITIRQASGTNQYMIANAAFSRAWNTVSLTWNGGLVATISWTAHGLSVGDFAWVTGTYATTDSAFSGIFRVQDVVDANTFTVALRREPGATASTSAQPGTIRAKLADTDIEISGGKWDYNSAGNLLGAGNNRHIGLLAGVRRAWVHDTRTANTMAYTYPAITATISGGAVASYAITYAGANLPSSGVTLLLSGGDATTMPSNPTVTVSGGVVTAVNGGLGGTGMLVPPTVYMGSLEEYKYFWSVVARDSVFERIASNGLGGADVIHLYGPSFDNVIRDIQATEPDDVAIVQPNNPAAYTAYDLTQLNSQAGGDCIGVTIDGVDAFSTLGSLAAVYAQPNFWVDQIRIKNIRGYSVAGPAVVRITPSTDTGTSQIGAIEIDGVSWTNPFLPAINISAGTASTPLVMDQLTVRNVSSPIIPQTNGTVSFGVLSVAGSGTSSIKHLVAERWNLRLNTNGYNAINVNSAAMTINQLTVRDFTMVNSTGSAVGNLVVLQNGVINRVSLDKLHLSTLNSAFSLLSGATTGNTQVELTDSNLVLMAAGLTLSGGGSSYTASVYLRGNTINGNMTNGLVRVAGGTSNPPTVNITSGGGNIGVPANKWIVAIANTQTPVVNATGTDIQVDLSTIGTGPIALGRNPGSVVYNTNAALGTLAAAGLVTNDATTTSGSWHLNTGPTLVY